MSQNTPILFVDPHLPPNWKREVKEKPGKGKSSGKNIRHEIFIHSPDNKIFKNFSQLEKYLKSVNSAYKAEDFDFTLCGRANSRSKKRKLSEVDISDTNIINNAEPNLESGKRRSGRIKQRSLDEMDTSKTEKAHAKTTKEPSPSKTPSTSPIKKHKKIPTHEPDSIIPKDLKPDETVAIVHQETTTTTTIVGHDEEGQETAITSVQIEKSDVDILTNESASKTLDIIDQALEQKVDIEKAIEEKMESSATLALEENLVANINNEVLPKSISTTVNESMIVNTSETDISVSAATMILEDTFSKSETSDLNHTTHHHSHKHHNHLENGDEIKKGLSIAVNDSSSSIIISHHVSDTIDNLTKDHHVHSIKHTSGNAISQNSSVLETMN